MFKEENISNNFNNRNLCQSVKIRENLCYAFEERRNNNPLSFVDPTGLEDDKIEPKVEPVSKAHIQ